MTDIEYTDIELGNFLRMWVCSNFEGKSLFHGLKKVEKSESREKYKLGGQQKSDYTIVYFPSRSLVCLTSKLAKITSEEELSSVSLPALGSFKPK